MSDSPSPISAARVDIGPCEVITDLSSPRHSRHTIFTFIFYFDNFQHKLKARYSELNELHNEFIKSNFFKTIFGDDRNKIPKFPGKTWFKDMTKPENYYQRAKELLEYFEGLTKHFTIINHPQFQKAIGYNKYLNDPNHPYHYYTIYNTPLNAQNSSYNQNICNVLNNNNNNSNNNKLSSPVSSLSKNKCSYRNILTYEDNSNSRSYDMILSKSLSKYTLDEKYEIVLNVWIRNLNIVNRTPVDILSEICKFCIPPVQFHPIYHGKNISSLEENRMVAVRGERRPGGYCDGVVLSEFPLPRYNYTWGSLIYYEIECKKLSNGWAGGLKLGVTTLHPSTITIKSTAHEMGLSCENTWVMSSGGMIQVSYGKKNPKKIEVKDLETMQVDDKASLLIEEDGSLSFLLNNQLLKRIDATSEFPSPIPFKKDLYMLLDVYGMTKTVRIVPHAPVPNHILLECKQRKLNNFK